MRLEAYDGGYFADFVSFMFDRILSRSLDGIFYLGVPLDDIDMYIAEVGSSYIGALGLYECFRIRM